jgi:hypothetical protein
LTIEYNDGKRDVFELGKKHGIVSGTTIPHTIVTDLKAGDKVKAGDVVAWNNGFFARDIFDKGLVTYKAGVIGKVALWESSDTIEDGCVISTTLIDKLTTDISYCKPMIIDFTTAVHNLVKVGDKVEYDSILCTLEDAVSSGLTESDPEAIAALRQIAASNPKAKTYGTVTAIEVVYFGKFENMHPTLQSIVKEDNKRRKIRSVSLQDGSAETGEIDEAVQWGGTKLLAGNVGIKIYIDKELGIGAGDKLVFSNALKTTISRVDTNPIISEKGEVIDANFGYQSVADRIVVSPEISGTMNVILKSLSTEMVNIYKKG